MATSTPQGHQTQASADKDHHHHHHHYHQLFQSTLTRQTQNVKGFSPRPDDARLSSRTDDSEDDDDDVATQPKEGTSKRVSRCRVVSRVRWLADVTGEMEKVLISYEFSVPSFHIR